MALSGRILGTFGGASNSQVRPVITWSATQSISGNYSTVTANLVFENYRTDLWNSYNRNGHSVTFTINGNKSTSSRTFNIANKSSQTVWTRTVRVNHNSDGKKSFSLSVSGNTGVRLGSYNISGTGELTQIPRASSLSSFSINANLKPSTANQVKLGISRATGSSYNHDIQLRDGNHVLQSWTGQGVPTSLKIDASTVNTLLNRMSNSTTRSLTLRVQTKSGSTNIGGAVTRNATATVDSTVRPTATGLSLVIDGTRRDNSRGIYVQGYSRVKVSFNEKAVGGARVSSRSIVIRHNSSKKNVSSINATSGTSGVLSLSGVYEVIATVTDSRGRKNTQTRTTFTVQAYSPPRITTFSADRTAGTPTTVNINREGSFSPIGTGHNTLTISVQRRSGTGSWANVVTDVTTTSTTFSGTANSTGNSVTSSYDFRVVLTDQFGGRAEATSTVSTQRVVLDIHKNEGVGIGKIREQGVLDVDGSAYFSGSVDVTGFLKSDRIELNSGKASTPALWIKGNAGDHALRTRGIDGANSNGTLGALYLNYNSDDVVRIGADADIIADRGQNNDGHWYRFYNGVQVCIMVVSVTSAMTPNHKDPTGLYRSNPNFSVDFPAQFGASPTVISSHRYGSPIWYANDTVTTTYVRGYFYSPIARNNTGWTAIFTAVGRWK